MNKEEFSLLGILFAVGAILGVGKLLASDTPLTPRQVIARAIVHGGLGLAAAAATVVIPHLTFVAQVGIACVMSSLGTSALEAAYNKWVKK